MTPDGLPAYGRNRLQLERWVREDYPNALIVRLPALYGIGLKKNFLFDLHTITPAMLKPEKYTELAQKSPLVRDGYTLADNGFYKLNGAVDAAARVGNFLRAMILTPLPSRIPAAVTSFYYLARLWQDVQTALQNGLTTLNLTTRPLRRRRFTPRVDRPKRTDRRRRTEGVAQRPSRCISSRADAVRSRRASRRRDGTGRTVRTVRT